MSRINKVIQQKEMAVQKRGIPVANTAIPVYDTNGRIINPEKKRRDTRLAIAIIAVTAILSFIYLPQMFLGEEKVNSENAAVKYDTSAIKLSSDALKNNPSKDFDGDGIENSEESSEGTNPWFIDSDLDGLTDYCELYVTKTNPKEFNKDYLIDQQKKYDEKKDKSLGSPYKIGNVILWADDYESKAYGSVVKTTTGYRFCNFSGYAQFPEDEGKYAYKVENGVRKSLTYREDERVWKVSSGDTVELYKKELEGTVDFSFFGMHIYASDNLATSLLSKILPDRGFITATAKTKMDVDPDTRDSTITDIKKVKYKKKDTYRFTMNTNKLNDLQFVRQTIKEENDCVAVSLYNKNEGEYVAIVYGYTYEGDLLLADKDSLEPVGVLSTTEKAKKIMNESGTLVSYSYFDFEGFGFNSLNGDRISFFATSSGDTQKNRLGDNSENTVEQNDSSENRTDTQDGESSNISDTAPENDTAE